MIRIEAGQKVTLNLERDKSVSSYHVIDVPTHVFVPFEVKKTAIEIDVNVPVRIILYDAHDNPIGTGMVVTKPELFSIRGWYNKKGAVKIGFDYANEFGEIWKEGEPRTYFRLFYDQARIEEKTYLLTVKPVEDVISVSDDQFGLVRNLYPNDEIITVIDDGVSFVRNLTFDTAIDVDDSLTIEQNGSTLLTDETILDDSNTIIDLSAVVSDALTVDDSDTVIDLSAVVNDSISITADSSLDVALELSDDVSFSEALNVEQDGAIISSDVLTVDDSDTVLGVSLELSDDVSFSDALNVEQDGAIILNDTLTVDDSNKTLDVSTVIDDALSVDDSDTVIDLSTVIDDALTVDDFNKALDVSTVLSDTLTVDDSNKTLDVSTVIDDALALDDASIELYVETIIQDNVGIDETVNQNQNGESALADETIVDDDDTTIEYTAVFDDSVVVEDDPITATLVHSVSEEDSITVIDSDISLSLDVVLDDSIDSSEAFNLLHDGNIIFNEIVTIDDDDFVIDTSLVLDDESFITDIEQKDVTLGEQNETLNVSDDIQMYSTGNLYTNDTVVITDDQFIIGMVQTKPHNDNILAEDEDFVISSSLTLNDSINPIDLPMSVYGDSQQSFSDTFSVDDSVFSIETTLEKNETVVVDLSEIEIDEDLSDSFDVDDSDFRMNVTTYLDDEEIELDESLQFISRFEENVRITDHLMLIHRRDGGFSLFPSDEVLVTDDEIELILGKSIDDQLDTSIIVSEDLEFTRILNFDESIVVVEDFGLQSRNQVFANESVFVSDSLESKVINKSLDDETINVDDLFALDLSDEVIVTDDIESFSRTINFFESIVNVDTIESFDIETYLDDDVINPDDTLQFLSEFDLNNDETIITDNIERIAYVLDENVNVNEMIEKDVVIDSIPNEYLTVTDPVIHLELTLNFDETINTIDNNAFVFEENVSVSDSDFVIFISKDETDAVDAFDMGINNIEMTKSVVDTLSIDDKLALEYDDSVTVIDEGTEITRFVDLSDSVAVSEDNGFSIATWLRKAESVTVVDIEPLEFIYNETVTVTDEPAQITRLLNLEEGIFVDESAFTVGFIPTPKLNEEGIWNDDDDWNHFAVWGEETLP